MTLRALNSSNNSRMTRKCHEGDKTKEAAQKCLTIRVLVVAPVRNAATIPKPSPTAGFRLPSRLPLYQCPLRTSLPLQRVVHRAQLFAAEGNNFHHML
jgi:hypothetical protein